MKIEQMGTKENGFLFTFKNYFFSFKIKTPKIKFRHNPPYEFGRYTNVASDTLYYS